MPANQPPFRADHVGSLLRPPALKNARAQRAEGERRGGSERGKAIRRDHGFSPGCWL